MKSVIFIAPPSSGKGTQSDRLIHLGYEHISTGDILRQEISKGSSLGKEIQEIMASGNLVSDQIVFELIRNILKNLQKPFILDGFPRTLNQALLLEQLFQELKIENYEVIYLDVELKEALKRALGRLTCECGASYNIYYENLKPQVDDTCDKCGRKLQKRTDDNEEAFKIRYVTFLQNFGPIKEYYAHQNKLHIIDGTKEANLITEEIKEILK